MNKKNIKVNKRMAEKLIIMMIVEEYTHKSLTLLFMPADRIVPLLSTSKTIAISVTMGIEASPRSYNASQPATSVLATSSGDA